MVRFECNNCSRLKSFIRSLQKVFVSTEACPEDYVELSFLRQCLENAMASELSPHERDVLRLRLGLDDGVTRTAREVVDVCGGSVSLSGELGMAAVFMCIAFAGDCRSPFQLFEFIIQMCD